MLTAFVVLALLIPSVSFALGAYFGHQHARQQRDVLSEELAARLATIREGRSA